MKKKPTKYLAYSISGWCFALAAIILESVALSLYVAKWSGWIWVLYSISAIGFIFAGVAIAMIFCINLDKDKSVVEAKDYEDEIKQD